MGLDSWRLFQLPLNTSIVMRLNPLVFPLFLPVFLSFFEAALVVSSVHPSFSVSARVHPICSRNICGAFMSDRAVSTRIDLSRVGRGAESPRFYRPLPTLLNRCLCGSLTQLSFEPALFIDFSLKSIFYHLGNKCHYFTLHYFITTSNHMMCR